MKHIYPLRRTKFVIPNNARKNWFCVSETNLSSFKLIPTLSITVSGSIINSKRRWWHTDVFDAVDKWLFCLVCWILTKKKKKKSFHKRSLDLLKRVILLNRYARFKLIDSTSRFSFFSMFSIFFLVQNSIVERWENSWKNIFGVTNRETLSNFKCNTQPSYFCTEM